MGRVSRATTTRWDLYAMCQLSTPSPASRSRPSDEDLLYVGTDDGLIWTTADGGANWRKTEVGTLPASRRAPSSTISAATSTTPTRPTSASTTTRRATTARCSTKPPTAGLPGARSPTDLPDTTLVWRIVQDHVNEDLLFLGTEFGLYFSVDGGAEWMQLEGGLPTIAVRDLKIQRREDDLVVATFGRSLYVLDDIAPLRSVSKEMLSQKPAALLAMRDVDLYEPRSILTDGGRGSIGSGHYAAKNPAFGAVFTYYLRDGFKSAAERRKAREKAVVDYRASDEDGLPYDVRFPGYDSLEMERLEQAPKLWLTVTDQQGDLVRRLEADAKSGIHRVAWDLRYPSALPVEEVKKSDDDDDDARPSGRWAEPGTYNVTLSRMQDGKLETLDGPVSFAVRRLRESSIPIATTDAERAAFAKTFERARADQRMQSKRFAELQKDLAMAREAIYRTESTDVAAALQTLRTLETDAETLKTRLGGVPSRSKLGEKNDPTIGSRIGETRGAAGLQYGPTGTARQSLTLIQSELTDVGTQLDQMESQIDQLKTRVQQLGGPTW